MDEAGLVCNTNLGCLEEWTDRGVFHAPLLVLKSVWAVATGVMGIVGYSMSPACFDFACRPV